MPDHFKKILAQSEQPDNSYTILLAAIVGIVLSQIYLNFTRLPLPRPDILACTNPILMSVSLQLVQLAINLSTIFAKNNNGFSEQKQLRILLLIKLTPLICLLTVTSRTYFYNIRLSQSKIITLVASVLGFVFLCDLEANIHRLGPQIAQNSRHICTVVSIFIAFAARLITNVSQKQIKDVSYDNAVKFASCYSEYIKQLSRNNCPDLRLKAELFELSCKLIEKARSSARFTLDFKEGDQVDFKKVALMAFDHLNSKNTKSIGAKLSLAYYLPTIDGSIYRSSTLLYNLEQECRKSLKGQVQFQTVKTILQEKICLSANLGIDINLAPQDCFQKRTHLNDK